MVNSVSAAIPQEAKDFMQSAKEKVLDSDKLRSVSHFFGFGDSSPYTLLFMPNTLCPRLKENLIFFYLNYILLTAVIFALTLIAFVMSPSTLIILGCLALSWFVVLKLTEDGVKFLGLTITRKEASFIMMIISAIVAFNCFQSVFVVSLSSASFLAFLHAATREATEIQNNERNKEKPLEPDAEFK
jgi:hypothetical protein